MSAYQSFGSFYDTTLKSKLSVLENERKAVVDKFKLYGGIAIALGILLLFFKAGIFPLIIAGGGIFYFYQQQSKLFGAKYKHEVIRLLVTSQGLNYDPDRRIDRADYDRSKLFVKKINRYYGDDFVSGIVGKTTIRFSELFTQLESGSQDDKTLDTIFRGIFFIADFNKKFIGETFVLPDVSEKLFGSIGSMIQGLNFARPELVKLEDPEFEKNFAVYSTDQVEARYILSTSLMQRILEFKKDAASTISLSFIDSHVYIAIPINKNLFEAPSFFKSIDNYRQLATYHGYITMCVEIVETLDLNTRIWTKE